MNETKTVYTHIPCILYMIYGKQQTVLIDFNHQDSRYMTEFIKDAHNILYEFKTAFVIYKVRESANEHNKIIQIKRLYYFVTPNETLN